MTADTLARRHDGQWVIVHSPDVAIHEQKAFLRSVLGNPTHPDFAILQFRDSYGEGRTLRFGKPEVAAAPPVSAEITQPKPSKKK